MNNIRNMRIYNLYTQARLANALGVDRTTVVKWETGQSTPRPEVLIKLSELFNCSVDELLKGGESNE